MNAPMDGLLVPPNSSVAEQSVLGGVMLNPDRIMDALAVLSPAGDEFYRHDHRVIWSAITDCAAENKPIDVVVVSEHLNDIGELEAAGGLGYLGTLAKDTPSSSNVKGYAEIVKEKFLLRQIISIGQRATELAFNPGELKAKDVLAKLETAAFDLADRDLRGKKGFVSLKEIYKKNLLWMDENKGRDQDAVLGEKTGFKDLDDKMNGLVPGDLVIIAGRPSMGKTTFAMNVAEHVSRSKPVAVFSMEMTDVSLGFRLMASVGGASLNHVRSPWKANENDWVGVSKAVIQSAKAPNGVSKGGKGQPLYIDDSEGLTVAELRNRARRLLRKISEDYPDGLGAVVIDYMQLMRASGAKGTRNDEISEISRGLKGLAKELDIPVIALSQLNRSLEQRMDKRPVMSDLRESGAIEQDADVVLFLYRDVVYNEDSDQKGVTEVIIAKSRNESIGTVRIADQLDKGRFANLETMYGGYE